MNDVKLLIKNQQEPDSATNIHNVKCYRPDSFIKGERDLKKYADKIPVPERGFQLFYDILSWTLPTIITTALMSI